MSTTPTTVSSLDYESPSPKRKTSLARWLLRIAIGGGVLLGLACILLPSLCKAREPANLTKCASNLHQIGLAIIMYCNDNHGQYPDTFATILTREQVTPAVFVCPSSNDTPAEGTTSAELLSDFAKPSHQSYVYLGRGLTINTAKPDTIVACERQDNHQNDGTNVLYGDGHVDWLDAKDAKQPLARALAATQSIIAPPR